MRKTKANRLLTRVDIQERLGCGRTVATQLINSGRFPNAFKIDPDSPNSHWRIPEADVKAYMASQRKAPRAKNQPPRVPAGA